MAFNHIKVNQCLIIDQSFTSFRVYFMWHAHEYVYQVIHKIFLDFIGSGSSAAKIPDKEPLYTGAELTIIEANLLLMQFSLKHSLTKSAFADLLKIVKTLLPAENRVPASVYSIKKFFARTCPSKLNSIIYCSRCHSIVDGGNCTNGCSSPSHEFLSVPIAPQLKRMFEGMYMVLAIMFCMRLNEYWKVYRYALFNVQIPDKHIWTSLQKCRAHSRDSQIRDVYDGTQYKKHHSFTTAEGNVSLLMNTDGVAIFRSSSYSIWPIWLSINELPPNER